VFADSSAIAKQVAAQAAPGQAESPLGSAALESYIVRYKRGVPIGAVVIGQLPDKRRFYAVLEETNPEVLTDLANGHLDAALLRVESGEATNKARLA